MRTREDLERELKHLEYEYQSLVRDQRAGDNVQTEIGQCFIAMNTIKEQLD